MLKNCKVLEFLEKNPKRIYERLQSARISGKMQKIMKKMQSAIIIENN